MLEPLQIGHERRPRDFWLSKSSEDANHPSKRCRSGQISSKTITFTFPGKYSTVPESHWCAIPLFQEAIQAAYTHAAHSAPRAIQRTTITAPAIRLTGRPRAVMAGRARRTSPRACPALLENRM